MLAKKLLGLVIALGLSSSTGCCRMWEHWCGDRHHYQAAPCCPAPCPPACTPAYSSPGGVAPVPNAPGVTSWQRCP